MRISQFNNFSKIIHLNPEQDFNHPSSSKNNTGVITNHQYAILPGLQPVHDGNSHKQEIPAKSTLFVTTNNVSSNCAYPRPHRSFFQFREKDEVPSLKNALDLRDGYLPPPPDQSLPHFSEKHEAPVLDCIGFTGPPINMYYSRLSRNEQYQSKFHLRRK